MFGKGVTRVHAWKHKRVTHIKCLTFIGDGSFEVGMSMNTKSICYKVGISEHRINTPKEK